MFLCSGDAIARSNHTVPTVVNDKPRKHRKKNTVIDEDEEILTSEVGFFSSIALNTANCTQYIASISSSRPQYTLPLPTPTYSFNYYLNAYLHEQVTIAYLCGINVSAGG